MEQDAIQQGIDTVVPFITQYGMQVLGAVVILVVGIIARVALVAMVANPWPLLDTLLGFLDLPPFLVGPNWCGSEEEQGAEDGEEARNQRHHPIS